MSLTAFPLIVLVGLIRAGWNIVAKQAGGDARFAFFTAFLVMFIWAPLGWWMGRAELPRWGATEWGFVFAGGLLHVGYFVVLLRGYRRSISLWCIRWRAVRDRWGLPAGPGLLRAARDPVARQRVHKGIVYGLLTGAFIAAYTPWSTATP